MDNSQMTAKKSAAKSAASPAASSGKGKKAQGTGTVLFLKLAAAVMTVVLAVFYRQELWLLATTGSVLKYHGHVLPPQPIPRIKWNPDEPFAAKFTASRMPLVLENAVPTTWPALGKWTPEFLAEHTDKLLDAYEHSQRVFTFYDPEKPLGKIKGIAADLRASHKILDLSTKQFIEHANSALKGEPQKAFFYYSGPLDDFPEEVQKDIGPHLDWLSLQEGPSNSTSVWMGYNGTTAHTHYDIFWNFNVQLYGTKRFTLFPPSQWTKLYQYPRLHPSYRQSQVSFENVDPVKFPLFNEVESYEIVVKPGDMLFIPPYWSHRVTALDLSISVNVFSDTAELINFYNIQQIPLDFFKQYSKSGDEAVYAAKSYFHQIAEGLMPPERVAKYWSQVYESRYGPLEPLLANATSIDFSNFCNAKKVRPKPAVQSAVRQPAKNVAALFKQMPKDIDVISLANYVEEIGRVIFGPENVGAFIKHCLVSSASTH